MGSTRRYKNLLYNFSLRQHIITATRKSKRLTDHISSHMNNKYLHTDVLMTDEISDHDSPYGIFNIKIERYEPRYKYVRNEKVLNMNDNVADFKLLLVSMVFGFDDPNDQIAVLKKLITDSIADHAPINTSTSSMEEGTAKKHLEHL